MKDLRLEKNTSNFEHIISEQRFIFPRRKLFSEQDKYFSEYNIFNFDIFNIFNFDMFKRWIIFVHHSKDNHLLYLNVEICLYETLTTIFITKLP